MDTFQFSVLMGKADSPNCEICNKVEGVHHLMVECIRTKRNKLVAQFKINLQDTGLFQSMLTQRLSDSARIFILFWKLSVGLIKVYECK